MISIVIPTYNEAENISELVKYLRKNSNNHEIEIIISDGGSIDNTIKVATAAGSKALLCSQKGRAAQMNYGASLATGNILFFVHADSFPPASYISDIEKAINEEYKFGRFRTKFSSNKWILKVNAFFTRFDLFICCGGDQGFFITTEFFNSIGGFNAGMGIMEDYEIVTRAKEKSKYKIIQKNTVISDRKYDTNSWLAVQKANYTIVQMYKKGALQQDMVDKYKIMLNYR